MTTTADIEEIEAQELEADGDDDQADDEGRELR